MQQPAKQQMQQNDLKAMAMRVLERSQRNNLRNNKSTAPKKQCNSTDEFRVQKLHEVAAQIIEVSIETGTRPEIGLGFFNALDWKQLVEGVYGPKEIKECVAYAKEIYEQTQAGTRLVEVSELVKKLRG